MFIIGTAASVCSCPAINPPFVVKHLGDGQSIVQIEEQKKYLLLPVEEASPEAKLYMIADNDVVRNMNVRLAVNKVNAARKSKVDDNTARMQSIKQLGV